MPTPPGAAGAGSAAVTRKKGKTFLSEPGGGWPNPRKKYSQAAPS